MVHRLYLVHPFFFKLNCLALYVVYYCECVWYCLIMLSLQGFPKHLNPILPLEGYYNYLLCVGIAYTQVGAAYFLLRVQSYSDDIRAIMGSWVGQQRVSSHHPWCHRHAPFTGKELESPHLGLGGPHRVVVPVLLWEQCLNSCNVAPCKQPTSGWCVSSSAGADCHKAASVSCNKCSNSMLGMPAGQSLPTHSIKSSVSCQSRSVCRSGRVDWGWDGGSGGGRISRGSIMLPLSYPPSWTQSCGKR